MHLLFAYGTLAPEPADVASLEGWVADAVRGRLYDLGPYPALVDHDDENADWVEGYVRPVSLGPAHRQPGLVRGGRRGPVPARRSDDPCWPPASGSTSTPGRFLRRPSAHCRAGTAPSASGSLLPPGTNKESTDVRPVGLETDSRRSDQW